MNYGMTKPPLGSQIDWGHPLSKGIVGCWLFNEGQGDIVNDISGNKNHGKLTNFSHPATTTSGWNPGKFGKDIISDGLNDYIRIPLQLSKIQNLTISFWLNIDSYNNSDKLAIEYTPDSNTNAGGFFIDPNSSQSGGGYFQVSTSSGDSTYRYSTVLFTRPAVKKWHFYTIVIDKTILRGQVLSIYVDGIQQSINRYVDNLQTIVPFANSNLYIMSRGGSSLFMNGVLSNLFLFSRQLIPQEVQQLYISPFCFIK